MLRDWENHADEVFFIGGQKDEIINFKKYIAQAYPKLSLKVYDGYAHSCRTELAANLTKDSKLIVGLGTPRQEEFAITKTKLNVCSEIYTCGAFISQTAQSGGNYYPAYINKLHLRWMWRIWNEPHVLRRILLNYPQGLYLSAKFYSRFRDRIH